MTEIIQSMFSNHSAIEIRINKNNRNKQEILHLFKKWHKTSNIHNWHYCLCKNPFHILIIIVKMDLANLLETSSTF